MTVDNNAHSPFRDRIYVTWTEFAADGTAYIYEVHSDDYGETFSDRVARQQGQPACARTRSAPARRTGSATRTSSPIRSSAPTATCTSSTPTSTTSRPTGHRQPLPGAVVEVDRRRRDVLRPGQGQRLLRPARLRHLPGRRRRSGTCVRAGEGLVDQLGVPRHQLPVGPGRSHEPQPRDGHVRLVHQPVLQRAQRVRARPASRATATRPTPA